MTVTMTYGLPVVTPSTEHLDVTEAQEGAPFESEDDDSEVITFEEFLTQCSEDFGTLEHKVRHLTARLQRAGIARVNAQAKQQQAEAELRAVRAYYSQKLAEVVGNAARRIEDLEKKNEILTAIGNMVANLHSSRNGQLDKALDAIGQLSVATARNADKRQAYIPPIEKAGSTIGHVGGLAGDVGAAQAQVQRPFTEQDLRAACDLAQDARLKKSFADQMAAKVNAGLGFTAERGRFW